jgi:para-nitrobenzyl esterase
MSTAEIQAGRAQATAMGLTTFVTGGPVEEGKVVADVGKAYETGNFRQVPLMIGATSGDMGGRTGFMVAGAHKISNTLAEKVPVYYYRFSYVGEGRTGTLADHASEIYFFFNNQALTAQKSEHDEEMGRAISGYVVCFVKTDPRNPDMGDWPRYRRPNGKMMDFTLEGTAVVKEDPWAAELEAAPAPIYPGLMIGGASLPQGPAAGGPATPAGGRGRASRGN